MDQLLVCRDIVAALDELSEYIVEWQRHPQYYGIDKKLYPKQLDLLQLIAHNPSCNVMSLAALSKKTKGTISLQLTRLIDLGLITKKKSIDSRREICLELTEKGQTACKYSDTMDTGLYTYLLERVPHFSLSELNTIKQFILVVIDAYAQDCTDEETS